MKKSYRFILVLVLLVAGWTHTHSPARPGLGEGGPFVTPKGWPQPVYDFKNNPISAAGFELGRKLFYDGRLSKDGNFPCASCHQQFGAFATYDHPLSHGYNNTLTTRNAPALQNLAWQKTFMWDGSIHALDLQPLTPVTAANEMVVELVALAEQSE